MIKPIVWPPNNKLPPDVAYPIGNALCEEKSVTVVKKGNIEKPIVTAAKYKIKILWFSSPKNKSRIPIIVPMRQSWHFNL